MMNGKPQVWDLSDAETLNGNELENVMNEVGTSFLWEE